MARVDLIGVCKTLTDRSPKFASTFSMQNLNLRIPDGKTLVVLGPSGCGKTTLLKLIAGLIAPDSGEVRSDDVDVTALSPGARRIGMVFQNYALYPHFSARRNVLSYFFFRKKTPALDAMAKAKYQRTSELMGVELEYLLDRKPTTLSGGEQQRVALGRCITRDAALFLVDEPFANLDQALREKYRANLKALLRQFSITTVYVTHDHHEALILADLLAIMDRARIEQVGTFQEIYDHPRSVFVAGFLNLHADTPPINLIDARHMRQESRRGDALVGVRPEDVRVSRAEREDGIGGTIISELRLPMKQATVLGIGVGAQEVHARISGHDERYLPGDPVWLTFGRYHVFERESGVRLAASRRPPDVDGSEMVPSGPAEAESLWQTGPLMELAKDGYRHILGGSVAFEHLPPAALDHIIARGLLVEVAAGETVLAEGTRGPGLYVVLEGLVEIFLPDGAAGRARRPTEVHLNTMGPGRCLGEYSLIDEHSTSAAARSPAGAKLFFLSREEFRSIAEGDARVGKVIYLNLLHFLITRLRAKDEELDLFMMGSL